MADELGSGMCNTYKYTKMYSGSDPQFVEGDIFRITVPLAEVATATVGHEGTVPHDVPRDVPHKDLADKIYAVVQYTRNACKLSKQIETCDAGTDRED